ncbi:hypothetical protein AB0P41_19275 [Streptomyces sp. NPDC079167]|uniref:hypothetical protein n=1 Tax=Streptomyces sp. NPDC079167 TaxID=3154513 RepID=UPI00341EFE88
MRSCTIPPCLSRQHLVSLIGAVTGLFWFVALIMAVSMRTRGSGTALRPSA